MKAVVDQNTCIGCGTCIALDSEVFTMNDEGIAEGQEFPEDKKEEIEQIVNSCPAEAITIE